MSQDVSTLESHVSIDPGEVVYSEDGTALGVVTGATDETLEVRVRDDLESTDGSSETVSESRPGQAHGEGYLAWRCDDCGEMGDLADGMPASCPHCGAPKTALFRAAED